MEDVIHHHSYEPPNHCHYHLWRVAEAMVVVLTH